MKTIEKNPISNRIRGSQIFWGLAGFIVIMTLLLGFTACKNNTGPNQPQEPTVNSYAQGLIAPVGIAVDSDGRLWVGEQGTGQNDSRISVITQDGQVHPFLTGLPSDTVQTDIIGAWRPVFSTDGNKLYIVQGEGSQSSSMSLLSVDVSGFSPGDSPLSTSDVNTEADIGSFVLDDRGFSKSNPYDMTIGPNGNHYIIDAGANAIIRHDPQSGQLSLFATFDPVPNPSDVGPPKTDAVPTGIVFTNGRFYVSALSGFPFNEGQANIYEVDMNGNVLIHQGGLTNLVDIAVDPRNGNLMVLQIAQFTPQTGFQPNTGQLLQLQDGVMDTVVTDLNFSSGMFYSSSGDLFISSLAEGQILKVTIP